MVTPSLICLCSRKKERKTEKQQDFQIPGSSWLISEKENSNLILRVSYIQVSAIHAYTYVQIYTYLHFEFTCCSEERICIGIKLNSKEPTFSFILIHIHSFLHFHYTYILESIFYIIYIHNRSTFPFYMTIFFFFGFVLWLHYVNFFATTAVQPSELVVHPEDCKLCSFDWGMQFRNNKKSIFIASRKGGGVFSRFNSMSCQYEVSCFRICNMFLGEKGSSRWFEEWNSRISSGCALYHFN